MSRQVRAVLEVLLECGVDRSVLTYCQQALAYTDRDFDERTWNKLVESRAGGLGELRRK